MIRFRSAPYRGIPGGAASPIPGTSGDPTALGSTGGGAKLTVYNPISGQKIVLTLPVGNWVLSGTSPSPGYRYKDFRRVSGPIKQISLKNGRLSLSGKGPTLYDLAGAPQGKIALRLRLGSGIEYCAVAPARALAAASDTTARFVGALNSPAPAVCPPVP